MEGGHIEEWALFLHYRCLRVSYWIEVIDGFEGRDRTWLDFGDRLRELQLSCHLGSRYCSRKSMLMKTYCCLGRCCIKLGLFCTVCSIQSQI